MTHINSIKSPHSPPKLQAQRAKLTLLATLSDAPVIPIICATAFLIVVLLGMASVVKSSCSLLSWEQSPQLARVRPLGRAA